ncbi:hypothetical protein GCM10009841_00040 [Microlunatus panaciterrae]
MAGALLLVLALALLGWIGNEYVGTSVLSHRSFEHEKQQLRAQWQLSAGAQSTPSPAPARPQPDEAFALLRIPRFGSTYEMPILAGTDLDTLAHGVGHYLSSVGPGQVGNFALAGHRVTHGQPFARLLELRKGDHVVVETQDAVYTYVIDVAPKDLTVSASDTWVLDPVPGAPDAEPSQPLITLTTCQDLFRSPDRSVGFGHLASTKNKA